MCCKVPLRLFVMVCYHFIGIETQNSFFLMVKLFQGTFAKTSFFCDAPLSIYQFFEKGKYHFFTRCRNFIQEVFLTASLCYFKVFWKTRLFQKPKITPTLLSDALKEKKLFDKRAIHTMLYQKFLGTQLFRNAERPPWLSLLASVRLSNFQK